MGFSTNIFPRIKFEEKDLLALQDNPDKFLIQRTLIYAFSASGLIFLWAVIEFLLGMNSSLLFFELRIGYSVLVLVLVWFFRRAGYPHKYYSLVGAVVFYLMLLLTLPMVIQKGDSMGYLLGFATIYYGTAVIMVWPLRYLAYPVLICFLCLSIYALGVKNDIQYFLTVTFLTLNVGGLTLLSSWLTWKNYINNKKLLEQLNQLTLTDKLTGLNNRRYFDMYSLSVWQNSIRAETEITIMMLDVDFFKNYNDNYGHQEGDVCLTRVAHVLQNSLERKSDFVARYGGEEFVIILTGTSVRGAEVIAERIISNMKNENIVHEYSSVAPWVTLSIGVMCVKAGPDHTLEGLVRTADSNLYKAKQSGRNRYEISEK